MDQRIVGDKTTSTALLYLFVIAFVSTVIAALIGAGRVVLSVLPSARMRRAAQNHRCENAVRTRWEGAGDVSCVANSRKKDANIILLR